MRLIPVQKRNALKRKGFTLIELLVVITIIVILMALTLGVISKVYSFLDETKVVSEVNRLAVGCNQFKSTFGRYPPSKILLAEQGAVYQSILGPTPPAPPAGYTTAQFQALAAYSVEYLSSIFPGINLTGNIHDWNGNLTPGENGYVILEGQQCLVYFLGGMIYNGSAPIGFNTDKTNPTFGSTGARLGPFFDFDASRFSTTGVFPAYPAYKDVYGTPYAYFAAKSPGLNNYPNRYVPNNPMLAALLGPNDCESLTTSTTSTGTLYFVPYFDGTVPPVPPVNWVSSNGFKFSKSDTFQIVSAGKDKQFGTGGQYNQTDPEQSVFLPTALLPAADSASLQANYDNITNVTNGRVVPK